MIKINQKILTLSKRFFLALTASVFATLSIGVLSFLNFELNYDLLFLIPSLGATVVLLFGFPESPFSQPKNVFFGHLITSIVGVLALNYLSLPIFLIIPITVGIGIFFMIFLNVTHPPAGSNPIIVIVSGASYDFILSPIISGTIILIAFAIIINRFILKKKYPINS